MKRGKPEKYIGLADDIQQLIKESGLKRNDALPSERKLAEHFQVNHLTIRKALKLLEQEGIIYKEPSRGNFVGRRPMKTGESALIGLIFPDPEIFFYRIFDELEKRFAALGLHPVVHITRGIPADEEKILDFFEQSGVKAIVAAPNAECRERYATLNVPTVVFDVNPEGFEFPYVISDDYDGSCKITEYLISLGHQHIAHISGAWDTTSDRRFKGYADTLKQHGIKLDQKLIKRKEYTRNWGYYAMRELLAEDNLPTAIFCGNDTIAAGALRYLNSCGRKVPDKFSVVGFGDTPIAEDSDITSVSQHCGLIAEAIWRNLQALLKGETPVTETIINTSLIVRGSTGIKR